MTDLDFILTERERLWMSHPIIKQSAVLPTRSVQHATKIVLDQARKARASVAFWADPLSGKSFCLRMIEATVKQRIPGCGVLFYEAVEDERPAEGRLLTEILTVARFAPRIERSLAGKRNQVHRSLVALAGPAQHLFFLADEAQQITNQEFGWFKAVINRLSRADTKVTMVLAGQQELKQRRAELFSDARSDLGHRFMASMFQFQKCMSAADFTVLLDAMDRKSRFPLDQNWSYTQFLFPRAYQSGFRFKPLSDSIWSAVTSVVPAKMLSKGISMEHAAGLVAQVCLRSKQLDAQGMVIPDDLILEAAKGELG